MSRQNSSLCILLSVLYPICGFSIRIDHERWGEGVRLARPSYSCWSLWSPARLITHTHIYEISDKTGVKYVHFTELANICNLAEKDE